LPQCVIEKIDRLRRSVFWKGNSKANGSDCLVAWDYVCRSFKNLQILLTKFVHRILTKPDFPCARWVRAAHLGGKDFGDDLSIQTRAWLQIRGLINTYRTVTCVQIGKTNGQATACCAISSLHHSHMRWGRTSRSCAAHFFQFHSSHQSINFNIMPLGTSNIAV
jgi:hypothetical protein